MSINQRAWLVVKAFQADRKLKLELTQPDSVSHVIYDAAAHLARHRDMGLALEAAVQALEKELIASNIKAP